MFLINTFLTMKRRLFNFFFWNWTDMNFVSLFFLNERNISTPLLMLHLKCTVMHYANSSSKDKPFLSYGSFNMLFRFFGFLIYVYFNEHKYVYVPLKWRPLRFFAKLHKSPLLKSNIVKGAGKFLATKSP